MKRLQDENEVDLKIKSSQDLTLIEWDQLTSLLRNEFSNGFTGSLNSSQISKVVKGALDSELGANLIIANRVGKMVGVAVFGQQYSLWNVFKFSSFSSFWGCLVLFHKLLLQPRIFLSSVLNGVARRRAGAKVMPDVEIQGGVYLMYVCVDKRMTGRGIGERLLRTLESYLNDRKSRLLVCHFNGNDKNMRNFYGRNGWDISSTQASSRQLAIKEIL